MSNEIFSSMAVDAIGEIMNISLGSSATAVSNLLDHRVDISTPKVSVVSAEEFSLGNLEPAVGVEIKYVTGLEGSNLMLLKASDVKAIVDILMGMDTPDEEFEMNDLTLSAVCEVMNQMMGAASTALSDFLGRMVNISTPQTFDCNDLNALREERLPVKNGPIVVIQFALTIEGIISSEFINVISIELAKELIAGFGLEESEISPPHEPEPKPEPAPAPAPASGGKLSQEEIEALMVGAPTPAPAAASGGALSQEEIEALMAGAPMPPPPAPAPAPAASSGGTMSQEEIEALMAGSMSPTPAPAAAAPAGTPAQQAPAVAAQTAGQQGSKQAAGQQPPQAAGQPNAGYYPPYMYPPGGWPQQDGNMAGYPPMGYYPPPGWQPPEQQASVRNAQNKVIQTQPLSMPRLENETELNEEQSQNLDLIMNVPLEIAVEIGRTQRKVQDILSFSKGSLVVLDKLAGDQVDLYVNGKCIAHGDVVVIDDNFGIRINEILRKPDLDNIS